MYARIFSRASAASARSFTASQTIISTTSACGRDFLEKRGVPYLTRCYRRQLSALAEEGRRRQACSMPNQSAFISSRGVRHFSSQERKGEEAEEGTPEEEEEVVPEEAKGMSEVEALKAELAASIQATKEAKDKALYVAAEMENVRAIAKRDADAARMYAIQKFAKQLLDVADNLERAVSSAKEGGPSGASLDTLLEGVEMTSDELQKVFKAQGLERYGESGDKFDPHLHDAMFEYEDPEKEGGTIGQVLKSGYTLHGRVIRAAQVGTVKAS